MIAVGSSWPNAQTNRPLISFGNSGTSVSHVAEVEILSVRERERERERERGRENTLGMLSVKVFSAPTGKGLVYSNRKGRNLCPSLIFYSGQIRKYQNYYKSTQSIPAFSSQTTRYS